MATYIMSDLHGDYERYRKAMEGIGLTQEDCLYILGDIVDRGEHPIPILQDMMGRENVIPILGNHEFVAWRILGVLTKEVTEETLADFNEELLEDIQLWMKDGGETTLYEFKALSKPEQREILEYIKEFSLYEEISCKGQDYLLVHAGLENFHPEKEMEEYELWELLSARTDYERVYFQDKILVTGHTPVQVITNGESDRIYKKNHHIAMDCGCGHGGALGVLCLDTMEEWYF